MRNFVYNSGRSTIVSDQVRNASYRADGGFELFGSVGRRQINGVFDFSDQFGTADL
jgi:hypothetical protein